ncbi:hypothetical protein CRG98_044852 [Punica granatum]|uniref:NB-ARC domain-containing protein n=1 Tax=Punica granatum TaxID=22663 RepID=A0A2I0HU10_PUNGR|nr:hypothetical protein CRG98_044852 [Punica granatum]
MQEFFVNYISSTTILHPYMSGEAYAERNRFERDHGWEIKTIDGALDTSPVQDEYLGAVFNFESFTENILSQFDGNQTVLVTVYDITNSSKSLLMYGRGKYDGNDESHLHESELKLGDPSRNHRMESHVYGQEDDVEAVVRMLLRARDDVSSDLMQVVTVTGASGIGKTTLSQLVYNDCRVENHFSLRVWICVTNGTTDIYEVTRTVLEAVSTVACDIEDLNLLQLRLGEELRGKRFLLVLDGWNRNCFNWDVLRGPFRSCRRGSRIVVTPYSESTLQMCRLPSGSNGEPPDSNEKSICGFHSKRGMLPLFLVLWFIGFVILSAQVFNAVNDASTVKILGRIRDHQARMLKDEFTGNANQIHFLGILLMRLLYSKNEF